MRRWWFAVATLAVSCSWKYMGSLWALKELRLQLSQTSTWPLFIPFILGLGVRNNCPSDTSSFEVFKTDDTCCVEGRCSAALTHPNLNLSLNPDLFSSYLRNWRRPEAGVPGAACVCDQGGGLQRAAALRGHWLPCAARPLDAWRQVARRKVWTWTLAVSWIYYTFFGPFQKLKKP